MNKRTNRITKTMLCAAGLAVTPMTTSARAAGITVDGTLDTAYGAPLAVQTNNTGFGDSTDTSGASSGGSELDAAYGNISGGNLYLFLSGNLELNGNHLNLFIADGRTTGQSVLSVAPQNGPGNQLGNMNGSSFSSGFLATYALDFNGQTNPSTIYVNGYDLTGRNVSGSYLSSFTPGTGTAGALTNGISAALNNTNVAGVNGSAPSMASASAASTVTTGLELAIPLSILGSPKGAIEVLADINGGGNTYLSNQFLPGLPTYENDLGGGGTAYSTGNSAQFNFAGTPGQYFTVPAAAGGTSINGVYSSGTGGSYNTAGHWTNGQVPTNPGDTATFGTSITAPATITLDGNHTLGQITFNSTYAYTITPGSPAGTLTIDDTGDVAGVNPLITVAAGNHVISAPVAMANGLTVTASSGTTLTISGVLSGAGSFNKSGPGTLILSAANTFTATSAAVLNGTLELDSPAAAAAAQLFLGDPTADTQLVTLNVGTANLTIANSIVTNQDDTGSSSYRTISGTYTSGNATFTGNLYLDGGVVFTVPAGATLTYAGVISNGQNGNTTASHDLTVGTPGGTTGTVVLSNLNTYTGATSGSGSTIYGDTFVDSGTLIIPAGAGISSNNVTVSQGATLKAAGSLLSTTNLYDYGTATLGVSTGTTIGTLPLGSINVGQGALLTFTTAANHSGRTLVTTQGLAIAGTAGAWTGQINLGNNDMDVVNGDLGQITSQVAQGYSLTGGANFAGQGIISSVAAADTRHLTTLGVIQNTDGNGNPIFTANNLFDGTVPGASDVLIKFTYFGDANLDGKVDGSDYSLIDAAFSEEQTYGINISGWYNGDFNYDGVVDGSDYALIDNAFNNQKTDALAAAIVATSTAQVAPAAVPEPATLTVATTLFGLAALRRRRQ
jgi:autotransporter-associated beta strand protein